MVWNQQTFKGRINEDSHTEGLNLTGKARLKARLNLTGLNQRKPLRKVALNWT